MVSASPEKAVSQSGSKPYMSLLIYVNIFKDLRMSPSETSVSNELV